MLLFSNILATRWPIRLRHFSSSGAATTSTATAQPTPPPPARIFEYCAAVSSLSQSDIWNRLPRALDVATLTSLHARLAQLPSLSSSFAIAKNKREAAVLLPLCLADSQPSVLFTVRSSQLKKHGGEVSFPGGMRDPQDTDLIATALRETEEEISVDKSQIQILGAFNPVPAADPAVVVHPFVAAFMGSSMLLSDTTQTSVTDLKNIRITRDVQELRLDALKLNQSEVVDAFTVSLRDLARIDNMRFQKLRGMWMPVLNLEGNHSIWGLTAYVTYQILWRAILQLEFPRPDTTKITNV